MLDPWLLLPAGWLRGLLLLALAGPLATTLLRRLLRRQPDPPPPAGSAELPSASLVIACRDEAAHLPGLLADLERLLAAEEGRLELLLVDDGSRDGSGEQLAAFAAGRAQVRLLRLAAPEGKPAALARALPRARGEHLLFTDADCRLDPAWARSLSTALGEADLVAGPVRLRDDAPTDSQTTWQRLQWLALSGSAGLAASLGRPLSIWGANFGLRRSLLDEHGPYEDLVQVESGEDLELFRQLHLRGARFAWIDGEPATVCTAAETPDAAARQFGRWLGSLHRLPPAAWLPLAALDLSMTALLVITAVRPALGLLIAVAGLLSLSALLGDFASRMGAPPVSLRDTTLWVLCWPERLISALRSRGRPDPGWGPRP
jgi:poly-beta-1,6-N-acetyl-D-glucosamine synthase